MLLLTLNKLMPQGSVQCQYNTTFKYSKSTTKTLGKSVKYVQGEIIQRKMSGEGPLGGNFQRRGYCPEWNYLGVIVRGKKLRGEFHRGQLPGK